MLDRWLLAHPRKVGESYFEHQWVALGFAAALFKAAFACLIHALVPSLFETTASRAIADLHERMVMSRNKRRPSLETGFVKAATSVSPGRLSAAASPQADP